jgi:hypothetical protein
MSHRAEFYPVLEWDPNCCFLRDIVSKFGLFLQPFSLNFPVPMLYLFACVLLSSDVLPTQLVEIGFISIVLHAWILTACWE